MNTSENQSVASAENSMAISDQFKKLKELFLLKDTGKTFAKSLQLLFFVLKESTILVWLTLCWCVVGISLIGNSVTQTAKRLSCWWSSLSSQKKSKKEVLATTIRHAMSSLISKARKQVGLQVD
ncbi:hypothetical protein C1752_04566 [Acaryochloris thomasi RCC1774]|uniref:Uncharacterized protein n=2 Tax=Acaryochloris TaxID=155977 RepID=A0A2W1JD61_9CYAN|nr:hypothetical protein C1752_04566 [Acaryochloris thomasi RCC1774]